MNFIFQTLDPEKRTDSLTVTMTRGQIKHMTSVLQAIIEAEEAPVLYFTLGGELGQTDEDVMELFQGRSLYNSENLQ